MLAFNIIALIVVVDGLSSSDWLCFCLSGLLLGYLLRACQASVMVSVGASIHLNCIIYRVILSS